MPVGILFLFVDHVVSTTSDAGGDDDDDDDNDGNFGDVDQDFFGKLAAKKGHSCLLNLDVSECWNIFAVVERWRAILKVNVLGFSILR